MDMLWTIIDLFVCVIETVILFKYMTIYFTSKFDNIINYLSIIVISLFSYLMIKMDNSIIFLSGLLYLVIFIFIVFLFKGNNVKKMLRWLILLVLTIGIENFIVFIVMTIVKNPLSVFLEDTSYRFTAMAASKILLYAIIVWLESRETNSYLELNIKKSMIYKILILLLVTVVILSLLLELYTTYQKQMNLINILALSFTIFCLLAISIYEDIIRQARDELDIKLINQQKKYQYNYAKTVESSIEEMKYIKHDIAKHLTAIAWYTENKEYTKLSEYMRRLSIPLEKTDEIIILGDSQVSALIYTKVSLAKKNGIKVSIRTNYEEELKIESLDLSILFGNIIDNAIEACMKLVKDKREINLSIIAKSGYFLIDCINTFDNTKVIKDGIWLLTNKENPKIHGKGLKIIQSIVNLYSGELTYEILDDKFKLKITILNKTINQS